MGSSGCRCLAYCSSVICYVRARRLGVFGFCFRRVLLLTRARVNAASPPFPLFVVAPSIRRPAFLCFLMYLFAFRSYGLFSWWYFAVAWFVVLSLCSALVFLPLCFLFPRCVSCLSCGRRVSLLVYKPSFRSLLSSVYTSAFFSFLYLPIALCVLASLIPPRHSLCVCISRSSPSLSVCLYLSFLPPFFRTFQAVSCSPIVCFPKGKVVFVPVLSV